MAFWTVTLIASLAIMIIVTGRENKFPTENYLCDPLYAEYESCETTNVMKKNYINPYPIDYIDEDLIARYYNDLTIAEEKRNPSNRPRSGCDCHVEIEYVHLGPNWYPQYYRNVTCQDQHLQGGRRCMKGFQCTAIIYPIKLLRRKHAATHSRTDNEAASQMPEEFRKCWKETIVNAVAGCVCSPPP